MVHCPHCGERGGCRHLGEVATNAPVYYDAYEFACPSCGYRERSEVYGGDTFMDFQTECPYCTSTLGDRCVHVLSNGRATGP